MCKSPGLFNGDIFPGCCDRDCGLLGLSRNHIFFLFPRSSRISQQTIRPDRIGFPNNCWSPAKVAEEWTQTHQPETTVYQHSACGWCSFSALVVKFLVLKPPSNLLLFWDANVPTCYNMQDRLPTGCQQRRRAAARGGHRPWALLVEFLIGSMPD